MAALKFFLRKHPFAVAVFALALAASVMFTARAFNDVRYFRDPAQQNLPLEPWMTPRFVGMSWGLPPEDIIRIMELNPARDGRPPSIGKIAEDLGITLDELQARVEAAAAERPRD